MRELLNHLATHQQTAVFKIGKFERIGGSANNILYHATRDETDLAVKFTIRDTRRRAWREYSAFQAAHEAGVPVLPKPILLDEETYAQPVVVAQWMEGRSYGRSPTNG